MYTFSSSNSTIKTTQFLVLSHHHFPTARTYLYHLQTQFLPPSSLPILRCCYGGNKFDIFLLGSIPNWRNCRRKRQSCKVGGANVRASARESPYDVLGVSPSATSNDIKRAYRKLALKYHPDVNKEANAEEKFMRIKHAYNTLLNSDSRTRYNSGNRDSDFSYSTAGRSQKTQEEEDFYGFGDFFRDLQEEFRNWEANASSEGKPKSLWEELAEIGEEFVEFLEKELNISDQDVNPAESSKDSFESFGSQRGENRVQNEAGMENNIKESIDEIEAALAQLKKELGL